VIHKAPDVIMFFVCASSDENVAYCGERPDHPSREFSDFNILRDHCGDYGLYECYTLLKSCLTYEPSNLQGVIKTFQTPLRAHGGLLSRHLMCC
jgi:hypothetical protein